MRYWYDLIRHYLSANSRHGTHSPFVYKLADKVIYKPKRACAINQQDKVSLLIKELGSFFSCELSAAILDTDINVVSVEEILVAHKTNKVIFLRGIYSGRLTKKKWTVLKASPSVVVTIDLFYFGVLIHRTEQPKENFKLRFPYSQY